jgi:hypothetical protein
MSSQSRAVRLLQNAQAYLEAGRLPSAQASLADVSAEDFAEPLAAGPLLDVLRSATGAELKATILFLTRLPLAQRE